MHPTAAVHARSISKTFGDVIALDGVDLGRGRRLERVRLWAACTDTPPRASQCQPAATAASPPPGYRCPIQGGWR